jgi:hypothetical protein
MRIKIKQMLEINSKRRMITYDSLEEKFRKISYEADSINYRYHHLDRGDVNSKTPC